jgi:hypothetical protein
MVRLGGNAGPTSPDPFQTTHDSPSGYHTPVFEAAFWKAHYGNVASVVALLLTVVGFIVTWRKQRKLREVTLAAQQEARQIIQNFSERLAVTDVSDAAVLAQDLRHAVRDKRWERVIDRAERLQRLLGHMAASNRLLADEREFFAASVDDARLIVNSVEKLQVQGGSQISPQAVNRLDALLIRLNGIDGRLKNAQLEVPNG